MIRKFKLYMVLAAASLAFSSCLDKYPENAIPSDEAVNTVDDVNQLVIGIYDSFTSSALYSGNLTLLPDIQTDLVYGVNGNTNVYGEIWRWNDILSTNTDIESVYGALYAVIGRCNFLLDHVEKVRAGVTDDDDLDRLDQYCGEAYFARALAYSELVKLFCKAYESDEDAAGQLGVVLNEHYDSQEPMVRATLKDSYQFILNDLDRAEELLQLEEDFDPSVDGALFDTVYFNEYTVYALRARIALYMKKWDEAVDYATKVIGDGKGGSQNYFLSSCTEDISTDVSYFDYMWTNDHGTEVIWKVSFTLNSYGGSLGTVFFNYDQTSVRP
ncbi:MAG TPA: RagB/SusD family nutrient uptake outer membrane protein, partial [Candidatus Phocaeicola excrementigallinarum]|nr:RagB/SusD family nutrient uptake outer membrane protein [Candidatus Phocaeicola excrementigallinarum]